MHGVIFTSLRHYVEAAHGQAAADAVFAGEPAYLVDEIYPDERLRRLLARVAEATGAAGDATLHRFGAFTAEHTFARLYPAFFAIAPSARELLLTVETRIHELVRSTMPRAEPPRLHVEGDGPDAVRIEYRSARRLCVFLRGLVDGTAAHYGQQAQIEEPECMLQGGEACVLRVRLSPS